MTIWDDPEFQTGGEFVDFTNVGDSISGTITALRTQVFDGRKVPQILLTADDGTDRTVTCGQTRLRVRLVELRPTEGDHIRITLTQIEKRDGGKTLKHFDVGLDRGQASTPYVAPAAPPPTWAVPPAPVAPPVAAPPVVPVAPVDPQIAAAALAALTPEQRAALGL